MNDYWVFDIETYPNIFTFACFHSEFDIGIVFEVSDRKDDSKDFIAFLKKLRSSDSVLVGFNNLNFDYPVIHHMLSSKKVCASLAYELCQKIIKAGDKNTYTVFKADRVIRQLDLMKLHHLDNKARRTSLKQLEFVMRSENIGDLPFAPGSKLVSSQKDMLIEYNIHDVLQTRELFRRSMSEIKFREDLETTSNTENDFLNFNDTKIGKVYFVNQLKESKIKCFDYVDGKRVPIQTKRNSIDLSDVIFGWIKFQSPEFLEVVEELKSKTVTETKNGFQKITTEFNGLEYIFGQGGLHASVKDSIISSDSDHIILDLDVVSYYPSLAIQNEIFPEHLGKRFCTIFKKLLERRKTYPKGTTENAMLKLALNGVYGDSNNEYSPLYDPKFTMSITINGQLLLCKLIEALSRIKELNVIQANTDGITVKFKRRDFDKVVSIYEAWQNKTGLTLESVEYSKMFILNVNNYIAVKPSGKIKTIGCFSSKLALYQNHSSMVVPKAAVLCLVHGLSVREVIENWEDLMDFMILVKAPSGSKIVLVKDNEVEEPLQKVNRYFVSHSKNSLVKVMPPLKNKTEPRRISVSKNWNVTVCNNLRDLPKNFRHMVNFDYYIEEVEKLCFPLRSLTDA